MTLGLKNEKLSSKHEKLNGCKDNGDCAFHTLFYSRRNDK